jgi:hypothetical protein
MTMSTVNGGSLPALDDAPPIQPPITPEITVGAGKRRLQGRRLSLDGAAPLAVQLAEALGGLPAVLESWWSPGLYDGDYRDSALARLVGDRCRSRLSRRRRRTCDCAAAEGALRDLRRRAGQPRARDAARVAERDRARRRRARCRAMGECGSRRLRTPPRSPCSRRRRRRRRRSQEPLSPIVGPSTLLHVDVELPSGARRWPRCVQEPPRTVGSSISLPGGEACRRVAADHVFPLVKPHVAMPEVTPHEDQDP